MSVFGSDWELPKINLLKLLSKSERRQLISMHPACFNPFFGKPDGQNFTVQTVEGVHLIRGQFSDGAGSYEVEWLIIQNTSGRTKLQNKEY